MNARDAGAESVSMISATGPRRQTAVDAIGLVLVGAAIGWTLRGAGGVSDGAWPLVALYAGAAGAYLAGRAVGALIPALLLAVLVTASLWVAWLSITDWMRDGRMDRPFGYPNAQAGFFALMVVASLMLASVSGRRLLRAVGFVLALGFAGVVLLSGSLAASILLVFPLMALAVRRQNRWYASGGAILVVLALAGTIALGLGYTRSESSEPGSGLSSLLTERRVALWSDALVIMKESPLNGVGLGRFGLESPTARSDRDARWAHNDFLQMGAETGIIGLLLLLAVFLWGLFRLAIGPVHAPAVALGAAALTALGIHASVDYVLRFPALPLVTAGLLGTAVALANAPNPGVGSDP